MVREKRTDEEQDTVSRPKQTMEDKIDTMLCECSLAQAESLLERAQLVLKLRRKQAEADARSKENAQG
jgi:hypothetical protein